MSLSSEVALGEVQKKTFYILYLSTHPCRTHPKSRKGSRYSPEKLDETVRSLSSHISWDITKGSEAGKPL